MFSCNIQILNTVFRSIMWIQRYILCIFVFAYKELLMMHCDLFLLNWFTVTQGMIEWCLDVTQWGITAYSIEYINGKGITRIGVLHNILFTNSWNASCWFQTALPIKFTAAIWYYVSCFYENFLCKIIALKSCYIVMYEHLRIALWSVWSYPYKAFFRLANWLCSA